MIKLPKWVIPHQFPALYDTESATCIEMTAKLYGAMNSLIDDYNAFVDRINTQIEAFESSTNKNYELFTVSLRQEFQDFIDVVELRLSDQDRQIDEAVDFMTKHLNDSITALLTEIRENGELTQDVLNAFNEIQGGIDDLETNFNNEINTLTTNIDHLTCYVTPEMFGAIGDGVADDTLPLQNAINHIMQTGVTLKARGDKTYCISQKLTISDNKPFHIDFNYAKIKATAQMDCVLEINTLYGTDHGLESRSIRNIIIECNELAKEGIRQIYSRRVFLRDFVIFNPQEVGIHNMKGNIIISDGVLNRTLYNYHSTGILIDAGATDSKIENIFMRDMQIAVEDNGGSTFYRNVHAWIIKPSELPGSICFKFTTSNHLHMCYFDTYETAVYCGNKATLTLNQCAFYLNMNFYVPEIAAIPTIFYCPNDYSLKYLRVVNCDFNYETYYSQTNNQIVFSNKLVNSNNFGNLHNENYFNIDIYTNIPCTAYNYYVFSPAPTITCEQNNISREGQLELNMYFQHETSFNDSNLLDFGLGAFNRYLMTTDQSGTGRFLLPCVTSDGENYFTDFLEFTNEGWDRCAVKLKSKNVGVKEIWIKTVISLQTAVLAKRH